MRRRRRKVEVSIYEKHAGVKRERENMKRVYTCAAFDRTS
jgi:hypothetical protein